MSPLPRLLICTTGLGTGGAEAMLVQVLRRLHGTMAQCAVISLAAGGKHVTALQDAGIPVHDLHLKAGKPSLGALINLFRITRAFAPTAIAGWMYHGNLAATLARAIAPGRPRLTWNIRQTLYSLDHEKRGSARVIRLLARLSRRPDAILYNSQLSARQHETLGYANAKTELVPNGFDLTRFKPDSSARDTLLAELNLPASTFLIGRIGRNATMKDHPTALAALAQVCLQNPQVHTLWIGTGLTAHEAPFASFLQDHPPLAPQFHFLGERQDLPRLTAALDLALSSSAFGEGFPNVVGEAMACAVPVVATDVGDTAWVVGEAGRIVPARDPAALAAACQSLIDSPIETRRALGSTGRARIESHFNIETILDRYTTLLLPASAPASSTLPLTPDYSPLTTHP
jgi:glycosyltransferase involved in cell wall biosynthesis